MASDREQLPRLPASTRNKILHPGVRIVSQRFAPYDDSPEEVTVHDALRAYLTALDEGKHRASSFGTILKQLGSSVSSFSGHTHNIGWVFDEANAQEDLERAKKAMENLGSSFGQHLHFTLTDEGQLAREEKHVLLERQSDPSQNGMYIWTPGSHWSRPSNATVSDKTLERRKRKPAPKPFYIQQEERGRRHRR